MRFEEALVELKKGEAITREDWPDTICIFVQFPDDNSRMNQPYIAMEKVVRGRLRRFPIDLSCESIFAEDWEVR